MNKIIIVNDYPKVGVKHLSLKYVFNILEVICGHNVESFVYEPQANTSGKEIFLQDSLKILKCLYQNF